MKHFDESAQERVVTIHGAQISVFSDGSVRNHRGKGKRRFGNDQYKGYKTILVRDEDKHERTVFVHRLVAMAFIPNPESLPQVNHKNGIKDDNRVENLEWCTAEENMRHRVNVLKKYGRATPVMCVETGEIYQTTKSAQRDKNISRSNIQQCTVGKRKTAGGYHWVKVEGGD